MKVMKKSFGLAPWGPHLWTREKARELRPKLVAVLESLDPGGTVVIDFAGVEAFDYSFINELVGKTLLSLPGEYPGRMLVAEHLTDYTRENLEKALEGMGLAMVERKGHGLRLLGKLHAVDRETFAAIACAKGAVTAAELKDAFQVNLTAMNERLSKLTGLGLLYREKSTSAAGREQYSYRAPS